LLVACGRSADQLLFAWVWDGTANPYRSCSISQTTRKRTPPVSTGLQAIDSEDTDEEELARHGRSNGSPNCHRSPCWNASAFITQQVTNMRHVPGTSANYLFERQTALVGTISAAQMGRARRQAGKASGSLYPLSAHADPLGYHHVRALEAGT